MCNVEQEQLPGRTAMGSHSHLHAPPRISAVAAAVMGEAAIAASACAPVCSCLVLQSTPSSSRCSQGWRSSSWTRPAGAAFPTGSRCGRCSPGCSGAAPQLVRAGQRTQHLHTTQDTPETPACLMQRCRGCTPPSISIEHHHAASQWRELQRATPCSYIGMKPSVVCVLARLGPRTQMAQGRERTAVVAGAGNSLASAIQAPASGLQMRLFCRPCGSSHRLAAGARRLAGEAV